MWSSSQKLLQCTAAWKEGRARRRARPGGLPGQADTRPGLEGSRRPKRQFPLFSFHQVVLDFAYLGLGAAVASFLQVALLIVSVERQAARTRHLYMKSIMRQDIAFFEKNNVGEVVGNMSADRILIQDAVGEKIGRLIQLVSSFLGGLVVAFSHGWLLTLVMLSTIPLLVLSTSVMSTVISRWHPMDKQPIQKQPLLQNNQSVS